MCPKCLGYIPSVPNVPETQMAHMSRVSQMPIYVPSVPNVRSVPNVPCVPCVSNVHVSQMSHVSRISCVPNALCVPNVQCVTNFPCVPNVTCVKKTNKAPQILMENVSAMTDINHMGGESHLLWLPLCTQRWGHVGLLLSAQYVLSVCLSHSLLLKCPTLSIVQAVKHKMLTRCWANVGSLSTTLSQH